MGGKTKVINITSGAPYDVYIGWQRPAWMGGGVTIFPAARGATPITRPTGTAI